MSKKFEDASVTVKAVIDGIIALSEDDKKELSLIVRTDKRGIQAYVGFVYGGKIVELGKAKAKAKTRTRVKKTVKK